MKADLENRPWPAALLRSRRGLTLVEVLVSVAIIGIMAAIGIANLKDASPAARLGVGVDTGNLLNRAVLHYGQSKAEIAIAAAADSADEASVIALLQTRDSQLPGSPYLPADLNFSPSSSAEVVRYSWTGAFFKVLPEGVEGVGVRVNQ